MSKTEKTSRRVMELLKGWLDTKLTQAISLGEVRCLMCSAKADSWYRLGHADDCLCIIVPTHEGSVIDDALLSKLVTTALKPWAFVRCGLLIECQCGVINCPIEELLEACPERIRCELRANL